MPVITLSSSNVERPVGGSWVLSVVVTDADGLVVTDAPVVTVTLPGGSTATPTVETVTTGVYRVAYILGTAGRYVARVVASGYGAADFVAFATASVGAALMPTAADVLDYLGETSWETEDVQGALDAEAAAQRRACDVPAAYPADLREALLRRVARNLAMRAQPLAMIVGDEAETSVIPGRDPEVRRLERAHPRLPTG